MHNGLQYRMTNPGHVTSCSAAPTRQPALRRCSTTSFPKGKWEAPSCGLMPAHPRSKRAGDPLLPPPVLIGSRIQRRPLPLGQAAPIQLSMGPNSHKSCFFFIGGELEAVRSSPEGARAPAPQHRLLYSLQQSGHVLKIHTALYFTTSIYLT